MSRKVKQCKVTRKRETFCPGVISITSMYNKVKVTIFNSPVTQITFMPKFETEMKECGRGQFILTLLAILYTLLNYKLFTIDKTKTHKVII